MRADVAADPAYRYTARMVRVIDGDTAVMDVDLGRSIWALGDSYRLSGLNAREVHAAGGPEARDNLAAILRPGTVVTLTSVKPDKFGGRYDAIITLADGTVLNDWLIEQGWAAPWTGKGAAPVPPWPREVP